MPWRFLAGGGERSNQAASEANRCRHGPHAHAPQEAVSRKFLPHAADVWTDEANIRFCYEIARTFYEPRLLHTLEKMRADILALQEETKGQLAEIAGGPRVPTVM